MDEQFVISDIQRNIQNVDSAKLILDRTDKYVASVIEQLRKSTDRAYIMFGLFVTVFTGLTGFMLKVGSLWVMIPCGIIWCSLACSIWLMFNKVIWVHSLIHEGNIPRNILNDENIQFIRKKCVFANRTRELYQIYTMLDAIANNQYAIDYNTRILKQRCGIIKKAMSIIKYGIVIDIVVVPILLVVKFLF